MVSKYNWGSFYMDGLVYLCIPGAWHIAATQQDVC